jgi:hypothetical protein
VVEVDRSYDVLAAELFDVHQMLSNGQASWPLASACSTSGA